MSSEKFVLKHTFSGISGMKNHEKRYGSSEVHFGVPWRIKIQKNNSDFSAFLCCQKTAENLEVTFEMKLISINGKEKIRKTSYKIKDLKDGNDGYGWDFMNWREVEDQFMVDDSIQMECFVEVKEWIRPSFRRFDESVKEFSDVVLVVENQKFYVSKLFLAFQSSYFQSLFYGSFLESTKSEIVLEDVDSESFQFFLELLHGESSITEENVENLLRLGDMFHAPTVFRRCEEFLIDSKMKLKEKIRLSIEYRLGNLKKKCLKEVKTIEDIPDVLPIPLRELNFRTAVSMLKNF